MNDDKHQEVMRTDWKLHKVFLAMVRRCDVLNLNSTSNVFALDGRLYGPGYLERTEDRIVLGKLFFAWLMLGPVQAGQPQPVSEEEVTP